MLMDNPFNRDKPDWVKEAEKRLSQKPTKAEIKAQKKAAKDREIMTALRNFMNAKTNEYMSWVNDGCNDVAYLASHAKRACVEKSIAWEYSRPFLMSRLGFDTDEGIKEIFDSIYDLWNEEPRWRKRNFEKPKK
jgi:hypothetical protein